MRKMTADESRRFAKSLDDYAQTIPGGKARSIFHPHERSSAEERIMELEMRLEDALRRLREYEKQNYIAQEGARR